MCTGIARQNLDLTSREGFQGIVRGFLGGVSTPIEQIQMTMLEESEPSFLDHGFTQLTTYHEGRQK